MTYEEKLKDLGRYEAACEQLRRLSERYLAQAELICEYRTSKMFPSVKADGMPHSTTVSDGMSMYAVRLLEMERELHRLRLERDRAVERAQYELERVRRLTAGDELLRLRFLHFLSYRDIEKRTGIKENTVRYRIKEAVKRL